MKNGKLWEKIKEVQNMAHQDGASERVRNGIYDHKSMINGQGGSYCADCGVVE